MPTYICPRCGGVIDTDNDYVKYEQSEQEGIYHKDCDNAEAEAIKESVAAAVIADTETVQPPTEDDEPVFEPPEGTSEGADVDFEEPTPKSTKKK